MPAVCKQRAALDLQAWCEAGSGDLPLDSETEGRLGAGRLAGADLGERRAPGARPAPRLPQHPPQAPRS